ncbi:AAA family ATPase [Phormidium tenue]|uniref:ORC1/DEAH AAA+ ATPase domain-containing protein n=1 Tax=Phormidium tenue NIES-30 TaxID=549789 RepID=A0A1U7IZ74_9CYAN|nr:ATP-binding protein [Phormidium tenue]MBD2234596.1 ATP-binding protein [Phormidium tenue FACHB-1052]OKH44212.1 hypothetical protein NIES30_23225 [Phormidium tenue NIES-30]
MADSPLAKQVLVEVLAPKFDLQSISNKTAEIEETFRASFIPTEMSSSYFKWLDELRLVKQCGRVIGPRELGKSRSSLNYCEEEKGQFSYVKAWSNSSSRRLFSQILEDIKHAGYKGNRKALQPRLSGSISIFGIESIIVDNADSLQREALLDLKQLHEETSVPIVLVGSHNLDNILGDDLIFSFPSLFEFSPLAEDDFKRTLRTIEVEILNLPEPSNLADGASFETLSLSTGGRMGTLIKVLTKAVLHSLVKGNCRVDESVLENITNFYGQEYIRPKNPQS